jgi:hypothetical protein
MKVVVLLEIGGRTVSEQHIVAGNSRKDWRATISDIACRIELGTYGPPGSVAEMANEDPPASYANPDFNAKTDE